MAATFRRTFRRPAKLHRIAAIAVHTSPLDQPGTGDAGGLNTYVVETSKRLGDAGVEVEIFTRATSSDLPPIVTMAPGVRVHHVLAGPYEGLGKDDLPAQLCAFTHGVLSAEAARDPHHYQLVHSHYWLSGQVGWLAAERWGVPLVHTAHTLAKVKNAALADGDRPEPKARLLGEEQVVSAANRLVANTADEARSLVEGYAADPAKVDVVLPGVDTSVFVPVSARRREADRVAYGLEPEQVAIAFVGRIQPLKAPDVLVRAVAEMVAGDPSLRTTLVALICGGPSGSGLDSPDGLARLAAELDVGDLVRFVDPRPPVELAGLYRAADLVAVPSHNESFGLVALEAQACGTPVVAAAVGGLVTAVQDGISGLLVDGHDPRQWATALAGLVADRPRRVGYGIGAVTHARQFGWDRTVRGLLASYRAASGLEVAADLAHA
ncbi:D-inositol-3-phosphate glycosyltransferase [Fodinicola feengrottensis]|uniref:D-inositol-3-phosphate glycosyltransferase n=1 Tax=Fodinicola feengrottensis TaxID=435914 RepID=UPI0031E27539